MACGTCGGGRVKSRAAVTSGDLQAAAAGADGRVAEQDAVYVIRQADGSVQGTHMVATDAGPVEVGGDYFVRFQDAAVALRLSGVGDAVVRKVRRA